MEKPTVKPKNRILNLLPKAAQPAVSFQNLPFSPGRDRLRAHHNKGFSGQILIPPEARGRSRNFETQEPTSPKVSCMGQIKHRKKMGSSKKKRVSPPRKARTEKPSKPEKSDNPEKRPSGVWKLFGPGRKSDASIHYNPPPQHQQHPSSAVAEREPPRLGQMRKFASSLEAFSSFDCTAAQVAPIENPRRDFDDSDEEKKYSDGEDDFIIPFSAPMLIGGGAGAAAEPRKEINLWKRRTMSQPEPIQLNKIRLN